MMNIYWNKLGILFKNWVNYLKIGDITVEIRMKMFDEDKGSRVT
jgi:hypothetical protein